MQQGFLSKLQPALLALLDAFEYAEDAAADPWDFAVSIQYLRELGLNETDLRWLVRKGLVQHACEVTLPGVNGREFRSTGDLTFSRRTCFILTDAAVSRARNLLVNRPGSPECTNRLESSQTPILAAPVPRWDSERRELTLRGDLVKRFKWQAANQELILDAFQEAGWPVRIDDPLPPQPEQDSKRRLSDTIKCLNRKQANRLIRFRGDGSGEGVLWELTRQDRLGEMRV